MSMILKGSSGINFKVDTVDDLLTLEGSEGEVVIVSDENRGGTFVYRSAEAATNNGGTVFNGWCRQYDGAVNVKWFGVIGGNGDELSLLQNAVNISTALGKTLEIGVDSDIQISNTLFLYDHTKIHSANEFGIVRTTLDVDVDGAISVISMGDSASFKTNVSITGNLRVQLSAGLTTANRRGADTSAFFAGNLKNSHLEIDCRWAENAFRGKCCFDITGTLKIEWCHKGLWLNPSATNSAGTTCTSFDMRVQMDFVIFPFVLEKLVYSKFTGYVEAIKKSYTHYESDEMAVVFDTNGCLNNTFEIGVEAIQGMLVYNHTASSYIKYKLLVDLSNENHFEHDAIRISNIPYIEQGLISLQTVGTFDFDSSALSGSSVTVTTNNSYLFRRISDKAIVNINGGFIEPGNNYIFANEDNNIFSNGSRLFNTYRYSNNETRISIGNGLVWIYLGEIMTNASGEITVAPTGIKQILSVECNIVRAVHATGNLVNIKTKNSPTNWTMICGLGAGYGIDTRVLAIET